MNARCSKTDAGRAEIKARALSLSRPARNLLFVIDGTRPVGEWMALVHGCTDADVQSLIDNALIQAVAAPAAARGAVPREASAETLAAAVRSLGYDQLYSLMTGQVKERLGLIKGYKMALDVERCANIDELRALALRFFAQVREEHGEAGMRPLRQALGIA